MPAIPFLIIGQGLAGTALAWQLHHRGLPFVIVDRDEQCTSSKIAAGLVTPITGMRLNLNWRYDSLYPHALRFYRAQEKRLNKKFYQSVPIVRLLRDPNAAALWQKRLSQPELKPFLRLPLPEPLVDPTAFHNPHGGFQQRHSGWLDTTAYLEASRTFFQELGQYQKGQVAPPAHPAEPADADALTLRRQGLIWRGQEFTTAVFCTGWEAMRHPWFDWVPFRPAQGTVLKIQADLAQETRIINRGCWVLPLADGTLRAGSTYDLRFAHPNQPAPGSVDILEAKLASLLRREFRLLSSQTAVRPIIQGRKALIGRHPGHPQVAFFNGLGSKGVLRAPWLAQHLLGHLIDSLPIEPALDLSENLP